MHANVLLAWNLCNLQPRARRVNHDRFFASLTT
ncbi:MAG: hypothetical protein QOH48_2175 [Actinomycetota bacterium]|nr:hypothetical protein [Actinomycetota bacterium]